MALWCYEVNIFEPGVGMDYPVVQHRFFGKTQAEATRYHASHRKTDSFMRGCEDRGKWDGVNCHAETSVRRVR